MQGYAGFRAALAEFLQEQTGLEVAPDQLAVTGGISLGLNFVAQMFGSPGDRVASEDPTYFLAQGILQTCQLEVVGIPVDAHGLDVEMLGTRLEQGMQIALCYVIPSFHNPCGVNLAPQRAERLVELAARHDFLIVADEPYPMLHFGARPATMMSYDHGRGRVLSLGSFSKILGPGLRLGWIHAEAALIDRVLQHGVLQSGGGLNPVVSALVHETIRSGFLAGHIHSLRSALARRARALTAALDAQLPELQYTPPAGGYFVWGRLPQIADTTELLERCRTEYGVGFTPGPRCAIERDLSSFLRLSFAFYDEGELDQAVRRLAEAVRASTGSGHQAQRGRQ